MDNLLGNEGVFAGDGLFAGGLGFPSDYGQNSGAYGARFAPASPDQPRPATIPGNNQGLYVPQASGPSSPTTGNYAQPWGAAATAGPVVPDPSDPRYAYQLRTDGSIVIVKSPNQKGVGKVVTAANGGKAYIAMRAVVDAGMARKPIDPAIAAAAITAVATITGAAISAAPRRAGARKRRKFDASTASIPPAPVESGFPMWVWGVGGLVVLAGVGGALYVATQSK